MGERGPVKSNVTPIRVDANLGGGEESKRARASSVQARVVRAVPNAPSWLDREGAAEWKRVVPELGRMGVLAKVDRAVLGMYCDAWSKWNKARRGLKDSGLTVEGYRGDVKKHPLWQVYRDAMTEVVRLSQKLLLNPNDRLRAELPDDAAGVMPGADLLDF